MVARAALSIAGVKVEAGLPFATQYPTQSATAPATMGEYRQSFGKDFYTKLVASGLFARDLPENMPWIPILQVGFGYGL